VRAVRDRADARWLPSRYRFALFRLLAYLRLRATKPQPVRGLMLMIDRDQSAIEIYSVAVWLTLTLIAYLSEELGVIVAIVIACIVIQIPMYVVSPLLGRVLKTSGRQINSAAYMLLFVIASLHYARAHGWIRFVAWQFLALVTLNAIAAMLAFALRGRIAALEETVTCAA
jgi:hypothetical protein